MDPNYGYHHGYMRDCMYRCFNVADEDSQSKNPINHHWEMASPGNNYHYCTVHRVYHCMATCSRIDQPCCGECAPAYYNGVPEVAWIRDSDRPATFCSVPLKFMQLMTGGSGQGQPSGSNMSGQTVPQLNTLFLQPSDLPEAGSALEVIPRHDITYKELGSAMLAHRRHPGLFILRFADYDGLLGWMLCGRSMTRESFSHLVEAEQNGDPIMKSARLWACQHLGTCLPQDVRWVCWTIYMLASKALSNPLPTEQDAWNWRSWLWYWYSKANELCEYYRVEVSSPEEDWFGKPPFNTNPGPHAGNNVAGGAASVAQHDAPAPSDQDDSLNQSFPTADDKGEDNAGEENNVDSDEDISEENNADNGEDVGFKLPDSGYYCNHSEPPRTNGCYNCGSTSAPVYEHHTGMSTPEGSTSENYFFEDFISEAFTSEDSASEASASEDSASEDAATQDDSDHQVAAGQDTSSSV
ncbi:hypothetical protein V8C42DRAFT_363710 [Trichoderma barbatum]